MSFLFHPTHSQKMIANGKFHYFKNHHLYSEEKFKLYQDHRTMNFYFFCELYSRLITGTLLKIDVEYTVNKSCVPILVKISRTVDDQKNREIYELDQKKKVISYTFEDKEQIMKSVIPVTEKFTVATPVVAPSMIFLNAQKIAIEKDHSILIIGSSNRWQFQEDPGFQTLIMRKIHLNAEKIIIDGTSFNAQEYSFLEDSGEESLKIYICPFLSIPYLIEEIHGSKIQIKDFVHHNI